MAYVYKHMRLDNNEIFYVGIGSDNKGKFIRAHSKKGRSKFWKSITKNIKYEVQIVCNDITWEEACEKERELIKQYGRRDLNTGTLCNLTDGGDGINGYVHTKERLLKLSDETRGSNNPNAKPCIHFDTSMKFDCLKDGCKYFNLRYGTQTNAIKHKYSTAQFYFENEYFERPTREQISKKLGLLRIGNKNGIGYKPTEETRLRHSEFMKGRKHSEETKKKMREAHFKRRLYSKINNTH